MAGPGLPQDGHPRRPGAARLVKVLEGINCCLPELPGDVRVERNIMGRNLLMQHLRGNTSGPRRGSAAAPDQLAQQPPPDRSTAIVGAVARP